MRPRLLVFLTALIGSTYLFVPTAHAETRHIIFPVLGHTSYSNDFGAPRVGHAHQGNDIFAPKHTPLLAAVDGRVQYIAWPEASYGYFISLTDADGYVYWYIHINNDHLGTDDGSGGGNLAYAPGIENGATVVKGQIIGYVGDSGNAETTAPHLHFEIHQPDGTVINPFYSLNAAQHIATPAIAPTQSGEFLPFGQFSGGANVAVGDLDANYSGNELVVGAGSGGGPLVRVLTPSHDQISKFYAYDQTFHGGVDVAIGDVNHDGAQEVITAPGPGTAPLIRVYSVQGVLLSEFLAYPSSFKNGVHVTAADVDGDGQDEIITSPGPGMKPEIHVYRYTGELLTSWLAYASGFHGGVDVAAVPVDVDTASEGVIITSPLKGGGPEVRTYTMSGSMISGFYAFDKAFHGGVRVAAQRMTDGQIKIAAVPYSGGGGYVREFSQFGGLLDERLLFERWWRGGFDVALDQGQALMVTTGGRRTSLRTLDFSASQYHPPFYGHPGD